MISLKKIFTIAFLWLGVVASAAAQTKTAEASFAGGCFWCMEEAFEKIKGVLSVTSGFQGGHKKNPSYQSVSSGSTGHFESILVIFDPAIVDYPTLLDIFWRNIDPSNAQGQFCDFGPQYRSAIFYHDAEQKKIVDASIHALELSKPFNGPIATLVMPASEFYPAEDYHQDYYKKNPISYKFYKFTCGRAQRLKELWGEEK
ncbi:MAG: peptide-methionine (S)-S-oxide reductase MsrA [Gammaproteobacteria bacterium]